MSARAAARLESLGFHRVYRYPAGIADWQANGWPTEGEESRQPQAADLAHRDVPTCRPDELLGQVSDRVQAAGWDVCVVVDEDRVVLGLLEPDALRSATDEPAETAMQRAPRTYRLNGSLQKIRDYLQKRHAERVLVTDSAGMLVGLVRRQDLPPA